MQFRWLSGFTCAILGVWASHATAVSLIPMEEPVTTLTSPSASISTFSYASIGGTIALTPVVATPLVCADTSAPAANGLPYPLNPVYYSDYGKLAATPRPFVFGASAQTPTVPGLAYGVASLPMSPTTMPLTGDSLGSLVCYGLDANGTRRVTRDIFLDSLEGVNYNSSVTLSVFHIPQSTTDYYGYTIDVTIPALSGSTDEFALVEGFDSSVFATTAAESTANIQGTWCQALSAGQSCSFSPVAGNINFSYSNGVNTSLQAPVMPGWDAQYHFVVKRYLRSGVNLPLPSAPLAIVALLSPTDLEENKLDDNVSAGTNQIANAAPAVAATGEIWSTFSNKMGSLVENTDSGTLSFGVSDVDTPGAFSATVTLNLPNGISMAVPQTNCSTTPVNQGATGTCTLDIPLNNATWWNASVDATYDGLFHVLATDATNGVYANGVSANASIVVTDALGKTSAPTVVPLHVFSSANNAPVVATESPFTTVTNPNNSQPYSTYSCSVSAGGAGGCGAAIRGQVFVDLMQAMTITPGPAAAFDELASQTTAVVPYSDPNDAFTNVHCVSEQQASPFAAGGAPIVGPSAGPDPTQYDINFLISSTPPSSAVSAICTLTITDQSAAFPNGQTPKTATKDLRIVINP